MNIVTNNFNQQSAISYRGGNLSKLKVPAQEMVEREVKLINGNSASFRYNPTSFYLVEHSPKGYVKNFYAGKNSSGLRLIDVAKVKQFFKDNAATEEGMGFLKEFLSAVLK